MTRFGIPDSARSRHVYISGKPGYGKSTLMFWMALQDIMRGSSICVLDPNGDLVEMLLAHVPDYRVNDTLYLDGLDPIPLDFMAWKSDLDRDILSDDLIVMFRRMSEGDWGPRMDSIFRYAALTVLEAHRPFLDIQRILTSQPRRDEILALVRGKPDLMDFWANQFSATNREAVAPIASRMAKFLLSPPLKTALGHPEPKLRIAERIERGMVLLVNLKRMGQDASNFYGSMIVSQIQQAVWRRGELAREHRKPLYLYCDEFQNFATSTFGTILSEARKFNLGLTLANQHPKQRGVSELMDDIKGCVSSFVLFRMDADHASSLKSVIRPYKPEDLEKLPEFRALYAAVDGSVRFITTEPPPPKAAAGYAEEIRKRTRELYSCQPPDEGLMLSHHGQPAPSIGTIAKRDPGPDPGTRKQRASKNTGVPPSR